MPCGTDYRCLVQALDDVNGVADLGVHWISKESDVPAVGIANPAYSRYPTTML